MKIHYRMLGWIGFSVFASVAQAKSFRDACPDIPSCIKAVSALTHEQYLYAEFEAKGSKAYATDDLELTAENANRLFTALLNMNQLSRVPVDATTFRIMRINDAKGANVPRFTASYTEDAKLPDSSDVVNLTYTATHPESVKSMENTVRTFSNMGARIDSDLASGTLMITSSANEIKGLIPTFRKLDVKIEPATAKPLPGKHPAIKATLEKDPKSNATPDPK